MNFSNSTNATNATTQPPPTKEEICQLSTETEFQFQTAFLIFILILTFVGNLLVVLAVIFFRRLRSITNYFIVSLAISDLLISIILPFRIDQTIHNANWCLSLQACITWIVIDNICSFASIWNLVIISIDRYTAIVHPFRYHSIITSVVGYGMIGFVWCFSVIFSLTVLFNWTVWGEEHFFIATECANQDTIFYTVVSAVNFYFPLFIILVMYGGVFRVAFNQAKAMAALQVASQNRGRRSSINLVREVKAAKTLAIVIGCFFVCWFPLSVLVQISLWDKEALLGHLPRETLLGLSLTFAYALPTLNSTLNPIIYALFNRDFRHAFIKLAKRMLGQRLGAVGFGEASTAGTIASTADVQNHPRVIRFRDHDSESSEALPTIPMRDPNAFYNDGYDENPTPANTLAAPHDTNSMETTLDDEIRTSSTPNGNVRMRVETPQANGDVSSVADVAENSSKRNLPRKLPHLETNGAKNTEDDVDLGAGKLLKPLTLPPIESTKNGDLKPPPSPARSERSELSSSSLVNSAGEQEDEDRNNDVTV